MRRIASALIALLSSGHSDVDQRTEEDEVRGDFWKEQEHRNPTP
jgi:hypothetical protein